LNTAEADPAYDAELEEYVSDMETMLGKKLEPGRGNAKCLRLTLDKVEMLHRSLTWYMVSAHEKTPSISSRRTTSRGWSFTHISYSVFSLSTW
jgi:hypothetical protein